MKPCLADASFLVPLLGRTHAQLGLVRLLSNQRVMQNYALTARAAWDVTTDLLSDERVDSRPEPAGIDEASPRLLRYPVPTQSLVAATYLAAFALTRQTALVTFDQGFRQFPGLTLELLTTAPAASSSPQTPSH